MKLIRYGRKENGETIRVCEVRCSEEHLDANVAIAKKESFDGSCTVEDIPDTAQPTADEKRDAQIFYTAMMTDTLLSFEEE